MKYLHLDRRASRYGLAVFATAISALARWVLPEALSKAPYLGFYPAVVVSAALGGTGPGLVSTFISLVMVSFVFGHFDIHDSGAMLRHLIWVVGSTGVSVLAGRLRTALARAHQDADAAHTAKQDMEQQVKARQQVESRLRRFFDTDLFAVLYWKIDGGVVDVNDQFLRMTGYTREDLRAGRLNWAAMTPPEYHAMDDDARRQVRETGLHRPYEKEYIRKDGTRVWGLFSAAAYDDDRSEGISLILDITSRRHLDSTLRESEARLLLAVETANLGLFDGNMRTGEVYMSPQLKQQIGYRDEELPNQFDEFQSRLHPEDHDRVLHGIQDFLAHPDGSYQVEFRFRHRDGSYRTIFTRAVALPDETGAVCRVVGTHLDITERKRDEAQLRSNAERLADIVDAQREIAAANLAPTPLERLILERMSRLTGADGASLEVTEGDEMVYAAASGLARDFTGLRLKTAGSLSGLCVTSGELQRSDDTEVDPRVDREACRRIGLRSMIIIPLRYGEHSFGVLKLMSSQVFGFDAAVEQTLRLMREFLSATIARTRAEAALRESEALRRAVMDNSTDAIYVKDVNSRWLLANPGLLKIVGRSLNEVLGKSDAEIYRDPDIGAVILANDVQVMAQGQSATFEERAETPNGIRLFQSIKAPTRDAAGAITGLIGVSRDITELKLAEEELRAAKLSAERAKADAEAATKAKDHFLAVLSHELRTPLSPVVATVSMLQEDPRFDEDTRESLEMIRRNVELEARLIDDLLDVTRIERGKVELDRQPTELCSVIRRAVEVCKPDIEARKLEFGIDLGPDAPYVVDADVARLQQVFWNLLKNAIKFTPVGGCVGIRCRRDADGNVIAEISDSGEGIDPAVLPRLFNAFEQGGRQVTRQFGGLGLGLTISKAMADLHGGTLTARSDGKGKGATFTLRLPLLPSRAAPAATRAPAGVQMPIGSARRLHILLVEDHGDTARIMRRYLSDQGHEVQSAADVATALKLATERPIDLVLSDLGLPDGSGIDLMRAIRARGINVPGIALSGFGQEQDVQMSRAAGFTAHLVKPISLLKLVEAMAKAMSTRDASH